MKHQKKNLKKRAPAQQPICGMWAAAKCCNVCLDTPGKTDKFRKMLVKKHVLRRDGHWVGKTTNEERRRICEYLGYSVSVEFEDILHKKGSSKNISLYKLLRTPAFFKTKQCYMVVLPNHALYVKTNKMKRKLVVADQRGRLMQIQRKERKTPDTELLPMLKRHVVSVSAVRKK